MTSDATTAGRAPSQRLHFPLQEDERVIEVCRRHWIFLWPTIAVMALVAVVPVIAISVFMAQMDWYDAGELGTRIFWAVAALWLLYWAVRIFLNWYRYNNDLWVITNQRIVDVRKTTPFNLRMSTADLVNVQDMTVERNGPLRTMLDYGDIVCKTASEGGDFTLSGIPQPREVQMLVDRERDRERTRGRA